MEISEILKEMQQDIYIKLNRFTRKDSVGEKEKRRRGPRKINIGNATIEELMSNRYYRRGRGGAIKQVR